MTDQQLLLFRRQYLQLLEPQFLAWPARELLRNADVQAWLHKNLFDGDRNPRLPPERYQHRVLKSLMAKIEQSIVDPNEDEISNELMSHLSTLMSSALPSESAAVQRQAFVTFTCPGFTRADESDGERSITLLERRHLISGARTTGFRTWEAALHLATYLLSPAAKFSLKDQSVLELGAGTGLLSILCAKHLRARHVTATDGDEAVVEALKENFFLNGLDHGSTIEASVLRWGWGLKGTWVEEECEVWPYDIVLGSDITYDKTGVSALATTLRLLFDLRPHLQVFVSAAVRNAETFEAFREACRKSPGQIGICEGGVANICTARSKLHVVEIPFSAKPMREQTALFYATAVPLKILHITRDDVSDSQR